MPGATGSLRLVVGSRRPARIITHTLPLTSGTRLGVYEITAQIGAGGMGEVYRATDTKLKRQVAIKVLPAGCGPRSARPVST